MLAVYVCQSDIYLPWTTVYWSPGHRFWRETLLVCGEGSKHLSLIVRINAIARQSIVLHPSIDTQGVFDTD
jgi:hypothetical protein